MPYLAYTKSPAPATELSASTYDGTRENTTEPLNDAAGAVTSGIVTLAGMLLPDSNNHGFIFAAVAPNGSGPFGQPNSGIAVVCLNDDPTQNAISLYQTAAEIDAPNVCKQKESDPSTPEVMIYSEPTIADFATMHWDGKLQRLYVGLQLTTSSGGGNGAKAIMCVCVLR